MSKQKAWAPHQKTAQKQRTKDKCAEALGKTNVFLAKTYSDWSLKTTGFSKQKPPRWGPLLWKLKSLWRLLWNDSITDTHLCFGCTVSNHTQEHHYKKPPNNPTVHAFNPTRQNIKNKTDTLQNKIGRANKISSNENLHIQHSKIVTSIKIS